MNAPPNNLAEDFRERGIDLLDEIHNSDGKRPVLRVTEAGAHDIKPFQYPR